MGKSCKVVVCGQASVGKTSILEQLLYGNHVVGESGGGGDDDGEGTWQGPARQLRWVPGGPVLQVDKAWPRWARLCLESP